MTSRNAILQNTPSAGKLSEAGQNVLDPERSSIVQRGIYQRVQEANGRNWLYYQLFLRQDFEACNIALATCEEPNSAVQGAYGIFMKGLIAKRQGKLSEALEFMKITYARDSNNTEVVKQLISLNFLTSNYKEALFYLQAAKVIQPSEDWFMAHHQGLCYERLGDVELAENHLKSAINIEPLEKSYLALLDFYARHGASDKSLELLERAKRVFPDSHVIAARLGIAQIKKPNDLDKGFGNLAFASSVAKNLDDDILLAVGSVMQRKLDSDGALKKFEVILQEPGEMNAAVLNNVGLSYFARRKLTSAKTGNRNVADGDYSRRILQSLGCLRKAQQLAPFDWRIAANLGYVARGMHLYATASYHLMAAIKLSRREPIISPYLLLAGVADKLEISAQANQLYKYCIKNSSRDPCAFLNYATFLLREGDYNRACGMANQCHQSIAEWELSGQPIDQLVMDGFKLLRGKVPISELPPQIPKSASASFQPTLSPGPSGTNELIVAAQVEPSSPR